MNYSPSNRIYFKILVFGSFVLTSILITSLISNLLLYLNTGATNQTYFSNFTEIEDLYAPKLDVNIEGEELKIKPDKVQINHITRDYLDAQYVKNLCFKENQDIGLSDYYLDTVLFRIKKNLAYNAKHNSRIESTSLSHHLKFSYFSHDAMFSLFTDSAAQEYNRLYHEGKVITQYYSKNTYKVIMRLEEGTWKIYYIEKCDSKNMNDPVTVPIDTVASKQFVHVKDGTFEWKDSIFEIKGINYYPKNSPWHLFWNKFNSGIIEKDIRFISNSGFNTVRIFLPYNGFRSDDDLSKKYKRLVEFTEICKKYNVKIIVTLFDFYSDYSTQDWPNCERYLEKIVTPFARNSTIIAWDVKNEPDLDYKYHPKEYVTSWLDFILHKTKIYAPYQMVTIGWSNMMDATQFANRVDFVSPHYYQAIEDFEKNYTNLKKEIDTIPIVIGEYGTHSYNSYYFPDSKTQIGQANYYKKIHQAFEKTQSKHYMAWTLYDFTNIPNDVVGILPWRKKIQENFGLITRNGVIKPAYKYVAPNFKNKTLKKKETNLLNVTTLFLVLMFILASFLISLYKVRKLHK